MKSFFNLVNSVVGGEEKTTDPKVKLPWEDYLEQAKGLGIRGSLKDVLRDEMWEIYTDEKRLLAKNPLNGFNLDEKYDCILKVLDSDLNLRELYRKVVPSKVNEELFWRNYFEITQEIKDRTLKRYAQKDHVNKDLHELRSSLLDELDKELEAEIAEPKPVEKKPVSNPLKPDKKEEKNSEIDSLKTLLQSALNRIKDLEERVEKLEKSRKNSSEVLENSSITEIPPSNQEKPFDSPEDSQ
jgi:hypothetical protein